MLITKSPVLVLLSEWTSGSMFMFNGLVYMKQEEYIERLAKAYRAGWEDSDINIPFFNGHYIDKDVCGDPHTWTRGNGDA